MSKVLLYSGGTDSWLIDKIWKPDCRIYVNTGGEYSQAEMKLLPNDVKIVDFEFLGKIEDNKTMYVPMRNLYFLMIASNFGDELCLGATGADAGSHDKDIHFLNEADKLMNYCLNGNSFVEDHKIKVETEFMSDGKYSLLQKYLDGGGTIETFVNETFTCHHPVNDKPCMNCKLCAKKFLLAYYYGYRFDRQTEEQMLEYMIKNMLPKGKENGTYFADRPVDGKYAYKAAEMFLRNNDLDIKDFA